AADEAFLRFSPGDAAHAAERRQVEKPLVVSFRVFPDEEAGAADVARVGEAHEQAIPVGCGRGRARVAAASERDESKRAIADAAAAIEQLHPQLGARVAAGVTVLDAARNLRRALQGC